MPHYLAMSGTHGCMPDYLAAHESWEDAATDLAMLFELGPRMSGRLQTSGYVELPPDAGADYAEVVPCDCGAIHLHGDESCTL